MKAWYKKLGYYENPFLIKPMQEAIKLYGQEQQLKDALYYARSGNLLFIQGEEGIGKTKFLRTLIGGFRGRIIYVDGAKVVKNINIEELLRKRNGVKGKLFGKKPREMILVLDNVHELTSINKQRIKYYFDSGFLHSVVFAGENLKKVGFSGSTLHRIGKRVIELGVMTPKQASTLAFERLDESHEDKDALISTKLVEKIYAKSNKNPKDFMINMHRVFEEMDFDEDEKVLEKHLRVLDDALDDEDRGDYLSMLGADLIKTEDQLKDKRGNKLMKIGEHYRCPTYDMFCGNCGAIVKPTDKSCPECNVEFENPVEE